MRLTDGTGNPLALRGDTLEEAIKREASLDKGWTNLVIYEDDLKRVTISQFDEDVWDVSVDEETVGEYENSDADLAVKQFIACCERDGDLVEFGSIEED